MIIRGKPNVDAFLDGGVSEGNISKFGEKKSKLSRAADAPKRTKKLFELPETMMTDLEQRCVDERRQVGYRVTQTEIVERALRIYLYGK